MNFGLGMLDEIACFLSEGIWSPFRYESIKRTNNLSTQHILQRISTATCFGYTNSHHQDV
jgi:hypothetical protein